MLRVHQFGIIGGHDAPTGDGFDAADLVLFTDRGRRLLGFRTAAYIARHDPFAVDGGPAVTWGGGYEPLAITLDRRAVRFWDFSTVCWLGPEPHPCVFWSNADAISERGLQLLVAPFGAGAVLAGPDDRGLPTPEALGVTIRPDLPRLLPRPLGGAAPRPGDAFAEDEPVAPASP